MPELVIFDCDGVLVDSDRISLRIQAERISALGLEMSYEDCVRDFLGLGMPRTLQIITERLGRPIPEEWVAELETAVRESFIRELTPVPGVVEALEEIELPTCVASSGSHEKMRFTLGLTGLYDCFAGGSSRRTRCSGASRRQTCSYMPRRACPRRRSDASSSRTAPSVWLPPRQPRCLRSALRPPRLLSASMAPTPSSHRWRPCRDWFIIRRGPNRDQGRRGGLTGVPQPRLRRSTRRLPWRFPARSGGRLPGRCCAWPRQTGRGR